LQPLEIASKNGVHIFGVEMAVTPEDRAKGPDVSARTPGRAGMLFDPARATYQFWMKNTHISLASLHPRRRTDPADCREHGAARKRWNRRVGRCARCWKIAAFQRPASRPATGAPVFWRR
jgi:hypothetical protein